jgi:arylsulfatase A-like enzyme
LTQGHANVRDNQFDKALADRLTIGSVLQKAGYATAAIGKWGLQGRPKDQPAAPANASESEESNGGSPATWPAYPTKRGFDFFFGYVRHADGHFHYPKEDKREVWENEREMSAGLDLCYTTDLFTARAKKWIVDQRATHASQPFFLYLAYDTPHAKLQNPPCAYPAGGGLRGGVQWTGKAGAMITTAKGTMDGWMHPDFAGATWDHDHNAATPEVPWPDVQKRYANDVRRIDDCVGDLLVLLKDLKIADNTLVVFTSDNGPSQESYLKEAYHPTFFRGFGPFDGIKRDTFEGGERMPTLVRWPRGIPAGGLDQRPSGQWDWLATFADLAGVPVPATSDGVSLLPSLTGRGTRRESELYVEYAVAGKTPNYKEFAPNHRGQKRGQMQAVYLDGYKGLRYDVKSAEDDFEIYDLAHDPQEARNLGEDPKFAGLQAAMKARALQARIPDASAKRPYDDALVPPVVAEPNSAPGLNWSTFEGEWPWMPDFRTLTPTASGHAMKFELPPDNGAAKSGAFFEGYFHAEQDGEYTFTLGAGQQSMLFIHDIRVLDEPARNESSERSGTVRLKAGWHPVRLYIRFPEAASPPSIACRGPGGAVVELSERNLRQSIHKLRVTHP